MSDYSDLKRYIEDRMSRGLGDFEIDGHEVLALIAENHSLERAYRRLVRETAKQRTENDEVLARLSQVVQERDDIQLRMHAIDHAYSEQQKRHVIVLTPAEVQSQYSRVQWAEGLILQLPEDHEGRNSWLMNYGEGREAKAFSQQWHRENCELKTERDCYKRSSEGRESQLAEAMETIRRQREFIRTLYTSRKARKGKSGTSAQSKLENAPKENGDGNSGVICSHEGLHKHYQGACPHCGSGTIG